MADDKIIAGAVIEVGYPFVWDVFNDGHGELRTWRPGTRDEQCAPDDFRLVADAMGTMILTVVSMHKPGSFPERVFFTRRWRDPSGKTFGKGKLHIRSKAQFRQMLRGYRHHFDLADLPVPVAAE